MKSELFGEIKGYLDGISEVISFYGAGYTHSYSFVEYQNLSDINKCIDSFMNESNIKRHNVKVLGYSEIADWESELFEICTRWFFDIFSMQNFQVTLEDDRGNITPAQAHRDSNNVVNKLLKLIQEYFEGVDIRVYKLHVDPPCIDEFEWEQIIFDTSSRVYVLHFYQQG